MTIQRTMREDRASETNRTAARHLARVRKAGGCPAPKSHTLPRPTQHLTANQYARLLSMIDDVGGVTTIDEISRALPRVAQPVSAVFDLCDAGILNVDWEAAFDGDMHVWRIDR